MGKFVMDDKRCIEDLKTIQGHYRMLYSAEPMCLGYAIERLEFLSKYKEVKVIGETREE